MPNYNQFEEINPEFYQGEGDVENEFVEEDIDELSQDFINRLIDKMM
jgi:hypothetical protein